MRELILAIAAVWTAAGLRADCVRNGGFDNPLREADAWQGVKSPFAVECGAGINGSAALVFSNADTNWSGRMTVRQPLSLKAGCRYRLEMFVRTEDIVPGPDRTGATFYVDWTSADGKWLGGQYVPPVWKRANAWQRLCVVTKPIPAEAVAFTLSVAAGKGVTGRICYDDVSVTEYEEKPVEALYVSAYRGIAVSNEMVTFAAALNLKDSDVVSRKMTGLFAYRGADGKIVRRPADRLSADRATLTLRADELQPGRQFVGFRLCGDGGRNVGEAACVVERRETAPDWRVRIDDCGRTRVGGRLFFPLGMYWGPIRKDWLEIYAKGPFNSLLTYHVPTDEQIGWCAERGLKVVVALHDRFYEVPGEPAKGYLNKMDELEDVTRVVNRLRRHPALLAWYECDEFPLHHIGLLKERRALLERLDPDHPAFGVFNRCDLIRGYLPGIDVLGSDPYPIGGGHPLSYAADATCATKSGSLGVRALWQVVQSFDWGGAKPSLAEKRATPVPTKAQMRAMTWQCVAGGANGLFYYSFFDFWKMDWKTPFAERWRDMCEVVAEVKRHEDVLLANPGKPIAVEGGDVLSRTWQTNEGLWVLVVNPHPTTKTIVLGLTNRFEGVRMAFGASPRLDGLRCSMTLNGEDQSLFLLKGEMRGR